jgi:hypothetical protein
MWATSAIQKTLTKVNNHPLGENSTNLVTLLAVARKDSKRMTFSLNEDWRNLLQKKSTLAFWPQRKAGLPDFSGFNIPKWKKYTN